MAAKLGIAGQKHGNVLAVARLERGVALDIHDRDWDIRAQMRSQRFEHPVAQMTSSPAVENQAWLAPPGSECARSGLRAARKRINRGHLRL